MPELQGAQFGDYNPFASEHDEALYRDHESTHIRVTDMHRTWGAKSDTKWPPYGGPGSSYMSHDSISVHAGKEELGGIENELRSRVAPIPYRNLGTLDRDIDDDEYWTPGQERAKRKAARRNGR